MVGLFHNQIAVIKPDNSLALDKPIFGYLSLFLSLKRVCNVNHPLSGNAVGRYPCLKVENKTEVYWHDTAVQKFRNEKK